MHTADGELAHPPYNNGCAAMSPYSLPDNCDFFFFLVRDRVLNDYMNNATRKTLTTVPALYLLCFCFGFGSVLS